MKLFDWIFRRKVAPVSFADRLARADEARRHMTAPAPSQTPAPAVTPLAAESEGSTISPYVPGAGRVMITNGGPHPPHTWAQATAEHIAPIAPGLGGERYVAAMKLQLAIQAVLMPHHDKVQDHERVKLESDADHLMTDLDPSPHLDEAVSAVVEAAKGTPWEEHFGRDDVQAAIRQEISNHFATSQHIERSWHVDRNPEHPNRDAWRRLWHPGGEG